MIEFEYKGKHPETGHYIVHQLGRPNSVGYKVHQFETEQEALSLMGVEKELPITPPTMSRPLLRPVQFKRMFSS